MWTSTDVGEAKNRALSGVTAASLASSVTRNVPAITGIALSAISPAGTSHSRLGGEGTACPCSLWTVWSARPGHTKCTAYTMVLTVGCTTYTCKQGRPRLPRPHATVRDERELPGGRREVGDMPEDSVR